MELVQPKRIDVLALAIASTLLSLVSKAPSANQTCGLNGTKAAWGDVCVTVSEITIEDGHLDFASYSPTDCVHGASDFQICYERSCLVIFSSLAPTCNIL